MLVPKNSYKKNDIALSELAWPQKKPRYDFDVEASVVELPKYKLQSKLDPKVFKNDKMKIIGPDKTH